MNSLTATKTPMNLNSPMATALVSLLAGINGTGGLGVIINIRELVMPTGIHFYTFYSFSNKFPYYITDNSICGTPETNTLRVNSYFSCKAIRTRVVALI
jgi:hypothetical protein